MVYMKKQIAILLILTLLTACASGSTTPTQGIEVGDGEFLITPDDFIARWNEGVQKLKEKNPDNKDIQHIVVMPDYAGSGKEVEWIGRQLTLTFEANDAGNLTSIEVEYYDPSASQDATHNFGFVCGALPGFLNPNTKFNMASELGIPSDFTTTSKAFDGDIAYSYICVDGLLHSISVAPKW